MIDTVYPAVFGGILSLLCSLHCTVGSGVYVYLVLVMGSACRNTEVSFIAQPGVIDSELGLASYGRGDTCVNTSTYGSSEDSGEDYGDFSWGVVFCE